MFFPNSGVILPYGAQRRAASEPEHALAQWGLVSYLDLTCWTIAKVEEIEATMRHLMLEALDQERRFAPLREARLARLDQDAEHGLETLVFSSDEVARVAVAEEAYRLFSGLPESTQAMPRDLEPPRRVFAVGRKEAIQWAQSRYRPEIALSEHAHILAFYRAIARLRQRLPEHQRQATATYGSWLADRIALKGQQVERAQRALADSWLEHGYLTAPRLRDQATARYREWDRPAFSRAVAASIALQASDQPSYGPTIAQDLGAEIVSFL